MSFYPSIMETLTWESIKKTVVVAAFAVNEILKRGALKGGNALDLVYKITSRASDDVDISIDGDFDRITELTVSEQLRFNLDRLFKQKGRIVLDYKFNKRPAKALRAMPGFWGGYKAEFKLTRVPVIPSEKKELDRVRKQAEVIGPYNKRIFGIDLSLCEYLEGKERTQLEGHTIFVYTLEMLLTEKLRAICQSQPQYTLATRRERAQDYYDIYLINGEGPIDLNTPENLALIRKVFAQKNVPLRLIGEIPKNHDYHKVGFPRIVTTVEGIEADKDFDFYSKYLDGLVDHLKPLWDE